MNAVTRLIIKCLEPRLLLEKEALLLAAREIGNKLRVAHKDKKIWMARALNAEERIGAIRKAVTGNIEKYNRETGSYIRTWD